MCKSNEIFSMLMKQYIDEKDKQGISEALALKKWRNHAGLSFPTAKACCQMLLLMGQPTDCVTQGVLDILNQDFFDHIAESPELQTIQCRDLKSLLVLLIEETSKFLNIAPLRQGIVALLVKQLSSLRFHFFPKAFILEISNKKPFSRVSRFTFFLYSKTLLRPNLDDQIPSNLGEMIVHDVWRRVVLNILESALDPNNQSLLQYCRYDSPLEFRALLWPMAGDWLLEEMLKLFLGACLELHVQEENHGFHLPISNQVALKDSKKAIQEITNFVSKSYFCYQMFLNLVECLYLAFCHRLPFSESSMPFAFKETSSNESPYLYDMIWKTISRSCILTDHLKHLQGLEYLLPSLRVTVLRQLNNFMDPSITSQWKKQIDPVAFDFVSLMDHLCVLMPSLETVAMSGGYMEKRKTQDFALRYLDTHDISCNHSSGRCNDVSEYECCITSLKRFTIQTLSDLVTISLILCHPTYMQLLSELFLEAYIIKENVLLHPPPLTEQFFLGLLILGLSFPALHTAVSSNQTYSKLKTKRFCWSALGPTTSSSQNHETQTSRCVKKQRLALSRDECLDERFELPLEVVTSQLECPFLTNDIGSLLQLNKHTHLFLRQIRHCLLQLRPCVNRFFIILKSLLLKGTRIQYVKRKGFPSRVNSIKRCTHKCEPFLYNPIRFLHLQQKRLQHSNLLVEALSNVFQSYLTFSYFHPLAPCTKKSSVRDAELRELGLGRTRRRRFFLDCRLLILIVVGLIGCSQRYPILRSITLECVEFLTHQLQSLKLSTLNYAVFLTYAIHLKRTLVSCDYARESYEAYLSYIVLRRSVLPLSELFALERSNTYNLKSSEGEPLTQKTVSGLSGASLSFWIRLHCVIILLKKILMNPTCLIPYNASQSSSDVIHYILRKKTVRTLTHILEYLKTQCENGGLMEFQKTFYLNVIRSLSFWMKVQEQHKTNEFWNQ